MTGATTVTPSATTGQSASIYGNFQSDNVLEKPEIVSNVGSLYKNYTIMSIADVLFAMPNEIQHTYDEDRDDPTAMGAMQPIIDKSLFRIQFSVLNVQPLNLFEVCQLYCNTCHQMFSFKTLNMLG